MIRIQPNEGIYMKINNKVGLLGCASPICHAQPARMMPRSTVHLRAQLSGAHLHHSSTHLPALCPAPPYPPQVPGLGLRIDTTRLDLTYKSKYDAHLPGEAHVHGQGAHT